MKFVTNYFDLSKTIKRLNYDNNNFCIEYFDGTISQYYCSDPNHLKELKTKMLEQAIERQLQFSLVDFEREEFIKASIYFILMLGLNYAVITEKDLLTWICIFLIAYNIKRHIKMEKHKRELKKYAIFFDLYDDLETINNSKFMECLEFEHLYQKRLDIDTIDDFTLREVKVLKKNLAKQKNED